MTSSLSNPSGPAVPPIGEGPLALASSTLRSLGFWPKFGSSATVMEHVAFIGWCVENVPHNSILALGGQVESGYFAMCQTLQLIDAPTTCRAYGRWSKSSIRSKVPEHIAWHNELHYKLFSTVSTSSTVNEVELLHQPADILFVELEGASIGLDELLRNLRDRAGVILLNVPRSVATRSQTVELWSRHLDSDHLGFMEGESTLVVGVTGGTVPPALRSFLDTGMGGTGMPLDMVNLFRSLGRRRMLLANDDIIAESLEGGLRAPDMNLGRGAQHSGVSRESSLSRLTDTLLALVESERQEVADAYTTQLHSLRTEADLSRQRCDALARQIERDAEGVSVRTAEMTSTFESQLAAAREALAEERRTRFSETATLTRMYEDERSEAENWQSELRAIAEKHERQLQSLSAQHMETVHEKDDLSKMVRTKSVKLSERSMELAESRRRQEEALRGLEEALASHRAAVKENVRLRRDLTRLRHSRSWRWTRPFRDVPRWIVRTLGFKISLGKSP